MSLLQALSLQEAAHRQFSHLAVIRSPQEVTQATVAAVQKFDLGALPVNSVISRATVSLRTPFKDISDPAFNTTKLTVKTLDVANADKTVLFTALELNEQGTEITADQVLATPTGASADGDKLSAELASMALKALVNLDVGEVRIYFQIGRLGGQPQVGT